MTPRVTHLTQHVQSTEFTRSAGPETASAVRPLVGRIFAVFINQNSKLTYQDISPRPDGTDVAPLGPASLDAAPSVSLFGRFNL